MTDCEPMGLELISERVGKKSKITAKLGPDVIFVDTIDPTSATSRGKFAKVLHNKCPAVTPEMIDAELLKIAVADTGADPKPDPEAKPDAPREVPANVLAEAEAMLGDPELIRRVCDDVAALGVAGERELALTVYLT